MQTKLLTVHGKADYHKLDEAGEALKNGRLVIFPTETVYGLGANALLPESVNAIFKAKGRPSDNPLIVHISNIEQVKDVAREVPEGAKKVMEALWPGPVTLVLKKNQNVPDQVTAGLDTVAVRMPSHPAALALLAKSGVPVAAPSANMSGKPSPTKAGHAYEDLNGKVDYIIDGGPCEVGLESTVLDMTGEVPQILRPGGVGKETLEGILGTVRYDKGLTDSKTPPKSPGMKYKHYAPKAQLTIVEGEGYRAKIQSLSAEYQKQGKRVGILTSSPDKPYDCGLILFAGQTPREFAAALFDALREFDRAGADVILAELPPGDDGLGPAIKNRIYKAAGGNIIRCDSNN